MENMSEVTLYGRRDDQGFDQIICLLAPDDPPEVVIAVPRTKKDVFALKTLMTSEVPVRRFIRGKKILLMNYGFGDAFGTGFGSSWVTGKNILKFRYGVWGSDRDGESSNFKELKIW